MPKPPPIDLDAMLTSEECAAWLKMPVSTVQEKSRSGEIPRRQWGHGTIRYWPREILERGGGKLPVSCHVRKVNGKEQA